MHWLHLSVPSADLLQRGNLYGLSPLLAICKVGIIIVIGSSWDMCLVFLLINVDHLRPLAHEESHVFFASALIFFGTFIQLNLDVRAISFVLISLS